MQEDDAVSRNERGDEQVLSAALRRILHAIDNFDELVTKVQDPTTLSSPRCLLCHHRMRACDIECSVCRS